MLAGATDKDEPKRAFAVATTGNPASEMKGARLVARRGRHTRPSRSDSGQLTTGRACPSGG